MALNKVTRARVILDLLQDGSVSFESAYSSVDKISPAVGMKWAERVYKSLHGELGSPPPTNEEYSQSIIDFLRSALRAVAVEEAVGEDRTSIALAAGAEADTEIGG